MTMEQVVGDDGLKFPPDMSQSSTSVVAQAYHPDELDRQHYGEPPIRHTPPQGDHVAFMSALSRSFILSFFLSLFLCFFLSFILPGCRVHGVEIGSSRQTTYTPPSERAQPRLQAT